MLSFLCLLIGFFLGFYIRGKHNHAKAPVTPSRHLRSPVQHTQLQRLYLKSMHHSDSDRIRELNLLSTNQSSFLRLLKQTFHPYEIAIKQQRFILLDSDQFPIAIFEYRDGTHPRKLIDQEDGLPLHLYKGFISSEALQQDYLNITSALNSAQRHKKAEKWL